MKIELLHFERDISDNPAVNTVRANADKLAQCMHTTI